MPKIIMDIYQSIIEAMQHSLDVKNKWRIFSNKHLWSR